MWLRLKMWALESERDVRFDRSLPKRKLKKQVEREIFKRYLVKEKGMVEEDGKFFFPDE